MKKLHSLLSLLIVMAFLTGCQETGQQNENTDAGTETTEEGEFQYLAEQFADLKIIRYKVPGFENLTTDKKKLAYYLSQAASCGRDIIYDQNYKHNLYIRRTLENIVKTYNGDKSSADWENFMTYTKKVWFANGIHHHYSTAKMMPEFDATYFEDLVRNSSASGFPLQEGENIDGMIAKLTPIMFDPTVDAKRVNKAKGVDMVTESANNLYEGLTQAEVEAFYADMIDGDDPRPISYGLNSKLVKDESGAIVEQTYKVGGMYGAAIEQIVSWLEKAITVAENDKQKTALSLLVEFYKTGDLRKFDEYNIAWVADVDSDFDVINGFIEVYGDPMGYRGTFESVVQMKDAEASARMRVLSENVQWFEDNSSILPEHKKEDVKGVTYKVITVVNEAGDASPSTPIGINLPNANWIRAEHGSKSVSLGNIVQAYDEASGGGFIDEFGYSDEEKARAKEHGTLAGKLHTALHEVVGHASGKLEPGVGTPKETIKNYASTLEEGRADLVALYFLQDEKMVELGLMPSLEVGKAEYDSYIRNGMMLQLRRLNPGDVIEEDHMRNRQLVASWAYEKGLEENVIEKKVENGNTYFVINDYAKLQVIFGELLKEIQRIKSQGDYAAAEALVEGYGVQVDTDIHAEVLKRAEKLKSAPYGGFINPILVAEKDENGNITDVKVEYPDDFTKQHLYYGEKYSFLPEYN